MKWTAVVQWVNPDIVHRVSDGNLSKARAMPKAARLVIESVPPGFSVCRFAADGAACGDTWHSSLEEVNQQLQLEFHLDASDWRGAD